MSENVLRQFGLRADECTISRIGSGHINQTFRVGVRTEYILQKINTNVFNHPEVIAANMRIAADHLAKHHPEYLFLSAIKTTTGDEMAYDEDGSPWRLFPYIDNTITIDAVANEKEAYNAARGFGMIAKNLSGCDPQLFKPTIERFHDLDWRFQQFQTALSESVTERIKKCRPEIDQCQAYAHLVKTYRMHIREGGLVQRVFHNDTKINNILFDAGTREAVCVIDLDTLMPGYFIYDFGDMVRTFVSPVNEEEKDTSKVIFRKDIYHALREGYLSQMADVLTESEKTLISFSGMMMTYIMALRMLTDFLNGNIYYRITYPDQNLVRARNQLYLLQILEQHLA